jgi:2-dehydro-3-deoxygluconokinase
MAQVVPEGGASLAAADTFGLRTAGAESNVAQGLAQLGNRVYWMSRLGQDALGERILADLSGSGVDVSLVRRMPGVRTGLFLKDPGADGSVVTYYRERSAASTLSIMDIDIALRPGPGLIHLSGVTPALSASCAAAVRYALRAGRDRGVRTSFDVNYRPVLWPSRRQAAEALLALADAADVVFVGLDEAHRLWGARTAPEVRALLPAPDTVIVKDGGRDATSFSATGSTVVSALPVEVVEPVGAGDAFAAGWLHGMLHGLSEQVRLRLGHLMASVALTALTDHFVIPTEPDRFVTAAGAADWPVLSVRGPGLE